MDQLIKIKEVLKNRQDEIITLDDRCYDVTRLCRSLLSALERNIKHQQMDYEARGVMKQETTDLLDSIDLMIEEEKRIAREVVEGMGEMMDKEAHDEARSGDLGKRCFKEDDLEMVEVEGERVKRERDE